MVKLGRCDNQHEHKFVDYDNYVIVKLLVESQAYMSICRRLISFVGEINNFSSTS